MQVGETKGAQFIKGPLFEIVFCREGHQTPSPVWSS
jgi:hypothetical protein